jgi:hypothetical protein
LASHPVQFLSEAAFFEKLLFQLPQLLVEQIVGLVDQADESVGGDFRRRLFDIRPISRIGPIFRVSELANCLRS